MGLTAAEQAEFAALGNDPAVQGGAPAKLSKEELAEYNRLSNDPAIQTAQPGGDVERIKNSFADPATREGLQKIAFTQHPINWMEAHAGDLLPLAGMAAGGALGGAAGGYLGGGVGAYPGAVAGAGAGAGGGEALRAKIGNSLGVNEENVPEEALKEAKQGAIGEAIGKPVVGALGYLGRNAYDSSIQPALKQGGKMLGDVLRKGGVMTATDLPVKAAAVANDLGEKVVDPILQKATQAGAVVDPDLMTGPLRKLEAAERNIRSPEAQSAADAAKARADYYDQQIRGTPATPGTPARVVETPSSILDMQGKPIIKSETIPGTPGTPGIQGRGYSPNEATQVKTRVGYSTPRNAITPLEERVQNADYRGQLQSTEDAVGESLGPKAEQSLHEANAARGAVIKSQTGQATAAENYQKLVRGLTSLRGTDAAAAGAGSGGGALIGHPVLGAIAGLLGKKGFDAARVAQMPAGYLLNAFAESPTASQAAIAGGTKAISGWKNQSVAGVGK